MKILCVIESGSWIESHIVGSLRDSGHTVHVFHYGTGVGEFYGRPRAEERLSKNSALLGTARELFRKGNLDLIFCYVYDDFLLPETAKALSRLDVPMVNYNVDMLTQWYRQTRTAKYFTRMLCAQRDNMEQLARYNSRLFYFPMAGRLSLCDLKESGEFTPAAPVTFVGTPMPYRCAVLDRLHRKGIPLAVYGKFWREGRQASAPAGVEKTLNDLFYYAWPKVRTEGLDGLLRALFRRFSSQAHSSVQNLPDELLHGFLPDGALDLLFRKSGINLGFTRMIGDNPDTEGCTQIKLRDFEIPLAGGFYLVEHVDEYAEMFESGVEVETWRTVGELAEKIRYYLDHPQKRFEIAAAGRKKAVARHTWESRFSMLFADLGIA